MKQWLKDVAVELGGRAGERMCRKLSIPAGRTRLLGLLEAPEVPDRAPRVLGVDEFAFRRGRTYGTVLVNVEMGRVVDILPDRTSETFATWLREHPSAEIICRGRATAYTRGIKEADRWHLLQNLSAAVEKTCHQHRPCLRKHAEQEETSALPVIDLPMPHLPRTPIVERARDRYTDVHRLLDRKWAISAIARHLRLDRKTVREFKTTPLDEPIASAMDFGASRRGLIDPFKPYLNSRFTASCTSAQQLFRCLPLAVAFGLLVLWGAVQVALGSATYLPFGWLPISLVAALALAAAAVFGMGVARVLPSVLTPPLLTIAVLLSVMLLRQTTDSALPAGIAPNRLALLSPVTDMPRQLLLTLSGAVHLGQSLWLLGLLATGLALLTAATRRARLLALAPVLAGAALALLVLPASARDSFVLDRAAAAPVCSGQVCVTEVHRSRLAELAPRGAEALRLLHEALGDQAPTRIQEETDLRAISEDRRLSPGLVLVDFNDPLLAHASGPDLTRLLVAQGLTPNCGPRTIWEGAGLLDLPAQSIAASWALGDHRFHPLEAADAYSRDTWTKAETAWTRLTALPPAEQRSRIARAHTAALDCRNSLPALTGEASA
ncbi:transposase [Kitasatospora sp. MMS16-BH015]|uniref:transposase n=1 Tax=Kitasatospora sp. MMS16-BH015 TaxID=2018025 RepID=UPI000CF20A33|nr:transposase [Kitasatospora sp. MMS16-BH015]